MQEEWWERSTCFLCERWWLLLLILALLLVGWFARDHWMPNRGATSTSTLAPAITPVSTPIPAITPVSTLASSTTPASAVATVTPTSELYGYINSEGGYAFNYPAEWKGEASGTDAYFQLPNNAKLEIIVRELQAGETFESLADDTGPLTIPKSNLTRLTIGGESAIRYEVLDERSNISARTYQILHAGRVYYLTLFAPPETGTASFSQSLEQFDQLMLNFWFLP